MQFIASELKHHKLKATPQRLAIYKILLESDKHPTVEDIYKSLEPQHSTMSLATVYKTVEALEKSGLIQSLNVGEEKFRYDVTTKSHPHLICTECKAVRDLFLEELSHLKDLANKQTDFDIKSEHLFFYGICANCQNKR